MATLQVKNLDIAGVRKIALLQIPEKVFIPHELC